MKLKAGAAVVAAEVDAVEVEAAGEKEKVGAEEAPNEKPTAGGGTLGVEEKALAAPKLKVGEVPVPFPIGVDFVGV